MRARRFSASSLACSSFRSASTVSLVPTARMTAVSNAARSTSPASSASANLSAFSSLAGAMTYWKVLLPHPFTMSTTRWSSVVAPTTGPCLRLQYSSSASVMKTA